jgi:hypothetical protein
MGKIVSVYEHFGSRTASRNELSSWTEVPLYRFIYLTSIGLKPGGSSTVHIYTQTIHRIQRAEHLAHVFYRSITVLQYNPTIRWHEFKNTALTKTGTFAFATILERLFPLFPWYNWTSFQNQFLLCCFHIRTWSAGPNVSIIVTDVRLNTLKLRSFLTCYVLVRTMASFFQFKW